MTTQNLLELKIHKLSQEQYDTIPNKDIDENALYLLPEQEASTEAAGLMSASDKKKVNYVRLLPADCGVEIRASGDEHNYIQIDTDEESVYLSALNDIHLYSKEGNIFVNNKEIATQEYVAGASVASADKLTTPRSIKISDGTNTGSSVPFDGSENITIELPEIISATTFVATSDKRLKENLVLYTTEKSILDLPVYKYNFKADENKKEQIGCLAQDLQEICPEIIDVKADGYLGIQESKIVYLLLEEVKKLKQELDELKERG